ncbi:PEP-CTERM sorting domain-containing protein [Sneathiella glossodoripedis]|uniref:PEP-CTERM sorting domain-containing protein n=1 Tax=Sneathiella glossodoripedis TaxID=418853 RepID=UPI0011DCF6EF|nr:PEP-CTERM sorting domain-containing protein [Sneathiella glossodoripedis]
MGTSTDGALEVGLRAKQRYPAANIFNYDGVDTYNFIAGPAPGNPSRALWNFEWSVNTNVNGSGGNLSDYTYALRLDSDPTANTSFVTFDPILNTYSDHALGNNGTGNGGGTVIDRNAADRDTQYSNALTQYNVAQNSWTMHWFVLGFDPNNTGTYTIELDIFDDAGGLLAGSSIDVIVSAVPLPAALPMYAIGVAILGFIGWRKHKLS